MKKFKREVRLIRKIEAAQHAVAKVDEKRPTGLSSRTAASLTAAMDHATRDYDIKRGVEQS